MADERLINKGRSVVLADLLVQGNTSLGMARHHATELSPCGWTPDRTILLEDLLAQLGDLTGKGQMQSEDARTKTRHEAVALQEADRAQENARKALPAKTLERNALKGRVLDLIDELNGIARIAFDDRPELRAKFNKDLLLRDHRARAVELKSNPLIP